MEAKDILTELEAAMRQLCEIKNRLRKVAAMLTPEQERQPDLFSDMGLTKEPMAPAVEALTIGPKPQLFEGIRKERIVSVNGGDIIKEAEAIEAVKIARSVGPGKAPEPRKTWKRLGVQMKDEAIVAAEKVGRKSGWCQRSDIERSLQRRNPERSREDIREAVNAAVKEMRLTCVKYNSYRFYRTADRGLIIASALARLTA